VITPRSDNSYLFPPAGGAPCEASVSPYISPAVVSDVPCSGQHASAPCSIRVTRASPGSEVHRALTLDRRSLCGRGSGVVIPPQACRNCTGRRWIAAPTGGSRPLREQCDGFFAPS